MRNEWKPRHSPSPMGRLPPMEEEAKPTGITYEEAIEAAEHGGTVTFEGREARVVGFNSKSSFDEPNTSRLTLDLGGDYLVISESYVLPLRVFDSLHKKSCP